MKIISLNSEDCYIIAKFFKENFSDGWTEEMLLSAFNAGRFNALAAKIDEEIIGVITFSLSVDSADVEDVVVLKSKRGQGVGSALIEEAVNKIQNAGVKKVFLEVRENNLPAIGAYKKFGFNQISVRKKYYSDGENALVMLKEF